jgi:uncharacterized ion transporter superfamily protein YfcC
MKEGNMKRHNLFKVVMISILVAVVLSWLLPVVYYSSSSGLVDEGTREQIGIFAVMSYVGIAVQYFSHIGIYVLVTGGLYGVLNKLPAYRNVVDKVVKLFKKKEWLFMLIAMLFVAGVTAFAGMNIAILVMFPFIIAIVLAMGYDRITAGLVTAGSVAAGLIGSAFSVNNTYGIDQALQTTANGSLKLKAILFVIAVGLMIAYTIFYARKHRDSKDVDNKILLPEAASSKKAKIWPLVVALDLVLIILVIGFISWKEAFGIDFFETMHTKVNSFAVFDFNIFQKLFGLSSPLGNWTLVEGSVLIVLASYIISFIYRVKFSDFISYFMNGCERALKAAFLVVLIYVVLVSTTYVPYVLTIVKPMLTLTDTLNVFTMSVTSFIASILSVESYYAGTGVLPYVTSIYTDLASSDVTLLSLIWQSMYGLAMLVAPTSVVLIATLAYLNVPYHKWLKNVWKVFLAILFCLLAVFLIKTMI